MKTLIVIMWALIAWSITPAWAQKPAVVVDSEAGWQKIGETVASFKSQDESIAVLGADEFAAIRIEVKDAPLQIDRLQVFYESGDMEEIDVKSRIAAGEQTQVFRLKHPDRDIQKVAFTYNTAPNSAGEKAEVILHGLKVDSEAKRSAYRDDAERAEENAERKADEIERETEEAKDELDESAEHTESDLERAAEKTGDAISETAAKVIAEIDDPRHETKVGPGGQILFIGDDSRCYYVNNEGRRVYVSTSQMKDKVDKD